MKTNKLKRTFAEATFEEMRSLTTDKQIHPEVIASALELQRALRQILMELHPLEKSILNMRFGLNGHAVMTRKDIAKTCDMSERRVRSIELRALQKLCQPLFRTILEGAGALDTGVRDALQHTSVSR